MLAMGWRGSARHWHRYQSAYLLLAGLATPLVLSVHTVVSFDFAVGIVPGWHTTIFPPYFVAGAIYSGFAMVLTIAIPLRKAYDLEDFITMRHLENMAKVMLATGLIVAYGYFMEFFLALYSGNKFDVFLVQQRLHGPYSHYYFALILCNILTPQLLWIRKSADECCGALRHVAGHQFGHVAGALRYRRHQLDARFCSRRVGPLPGDVLGLQHVHRYDGTFRFAAVPVRSRIAGHLHRGNARTGCAQSHEDHE